MGGEIIEDQGRDNRNEVISEYLLNDKSGKEERAHPEDEEGYVENQKVVAEQNEEERNVVMKADLARDPFRNRGLEGFVREDVFLREINVPGRVVEQAVLVPGRS